MKKFAQTAVLFAGLVGLSACAGNDVWKPYGTRTAGDNGEVAYVAPTAANTGDVKTLQSNRSFIKEFKSPSSLEGFFII